MTDKTRTSVVFNEYEFILSGLPKGDRAKAEDFLINLMLGDNHFKLESLALCMREAREALETLTKKCDLPVSDECSIIEYVNQNNDSVSLFTPEERNKIFQDKINNLMNLNNSFLASITQLSQ
jgi:hypothetical protein